MTNTDCCACRYTSSQGGQRQSTWPFSPTMQDWNPSRTVQTSSHPLPASPLLQPLFPIRTSPLSSVLSASPLLQANPLFPITSPPPLSPAPLSTPQLKSSVFVHRSTSGLACSGPSTSLLSVPRTSVGSACAVDGLPAGNLRPLSLGGQSSTPSSSIDRRTPIAYEGNDRILTM